LTVVACSAITGDGIAELRAAVRNLLRDADGPEHSSGEATE
jgi:hypothetical protein